jgi:hypothetical protein
VNLPGTTLPGDTIVRARLRRQLLSPSGRAVMLALSENLGAPLTARVLADLAQVSTTAVRDQAFRAARLGYATQSTVSRPSRGPTMAWQITPAGRAFTLTRIGVPQ